MRGVNVVKVVRITPLFAALMCAFPAGAAGHGDPRAGSGIEKGQDTTGARRNLPFAHGRGFATLDAYLAHLRQYAGPVGQPWWRQIRPGVYQHVTTMAPQGRPEIRTRAELMRQFGFTR